MSPTCPGCLGAFVPCPACGAPAHRNGQRNTAVLQPDVTPDGFVIWLHLPATQFPDYSPALPRSANPAGGHLCFVHPDGRAWSSPEPSVQMIHHDATAYAAGARRVPLGVLAAPWPLRIVRLLEW